jgi:hypothetical protein
VGCASREKRKKIVILASHYREYSTCFSENGCHQLNYISQPSLPKRIARSTHCIPGPSLKEFTLPYHLRWRLWRREPCASLLLYLRDHPKANLSLPCAAVLHSPSIDLTASQTKNTPRVKIRLFLRMDLHIWLHERRPKARRPAF